MRSRIAVLGCALAALAVAGCAGGTLRCDSDERYRNSGSVGPLRVPDDLSVPDESEALTVPPRPLAATEAPPAEACLEAPPDFFEGGAPG